MYKNLYDLKDETDFYFSSISIIKIFPSEIPPEIIYFINISLPLFNSVAFQIFLQKSFILIEKTAKHSSNFRSSNLLFPPLSFSLKGYT